MAAVQKKTALRERYPAVVNAPAKLWAFPSLREIIQFRHLLFHMTMAELKGRYKQTVLGLAWAFVSPIITMFVFTFVFNRLANVEAYDIPYPIFTFAGIVPWTLFQKGFSAAAISIVTNKAIIDKAYFPRLLAPLSRVFTGVVDFVMALVVLLIMMLLFGFLPGARALTLPFFILLGIITAFGFGLWFAAMHVRFRDVGQVVPFLLQMLMYMTPVAYPSDLLQEPLRTLYGLNPMVTVCDGFRWALLGVDSLYMPAAIVSTVTALVVLIGGLLFFQRMQDTFPDLI